MLCLSPTRLSGGHAVVERRATMVPHDVILLDDGASAVDLKAAVKVLGDLRFRYGDLPRINLRAVVRKYKAAPGWKGGREEADRHTAAVRGVRQQAGMIVVAASLVIRLPWASRDVLR
ncbi:MAG TPA: hypothetical protein VII52_11905 [Gemmatimonadaceae bacterium]